MGNKSGKNKNNEIKQKIEDEQLEIIKNIIPKRKQELLDFLLSNVEQDPKVQKINIPKKSNDIPFISFISKFENLNNGKYYHFILISNDIIIIPTKYIYNEANKIASHLSFPNIKEGLEYTIYNFIQENDNYNNNISVIKVLDSNFLFEKYFEVPDISFDFEPSEKYFINEKGEEISLGKSILNIQNDNIRNTYFPGSPIYIKRQNQLFLIGIVTDENNLHIFNEKEILDIRKKIENIELRFKLYQIKRFDFSNQIINNNDMYYIFQYDYINLEYLNLENKNITDKGMKALLNKSLGNINYLNLSNNPITDEGLTYLKYLSNLNELILLNMDKLSDDYFESLETNIFIKKLNILKCDKRKLTLKRVSPNYNNFSLPNFTSLKMTTPPLEIKRELKMLFTLENISSRIIELDLSNTDLNDNGMLRLSKNIHFFQKIETINLENTKISNESINI